MEPQLFNSKRKLVVSYADFESTSIHWSVDYVGLFNTEFTMYYKTHEEAKAGLMMLLSIEEGLHPDVAEATAYCWLDEAQTEFEDSREQEEFEEDSA